MDKVEYMKSWYGSFRIWLDRQNLMGKINVLADYGIFSLDSFKDAIECNEVFRRLIDF